MSIKNILLVFIFLFYTNSHAEECLTTIQKLKPSCNIVGESFKKLKKFSQKHKTIDQSLGIKKEDGKKFSLKEFSKKHKTVGDTIDSLGRNK